MCEDVLRGGGISCTLCFWCMGILKYSLNERIHPWRQRSIKAWIGGWTHEREHLRGFSEIVWAIDYEGWVVFWRSLSLESSFCSPVCRMFPGLNYRALTRTRPWVIICPFLLPSALQRILSSYGSSQPLPPGTWLWITLQKVKIIAPSLENLSSTVVTIRDSADFTDFLWSTVR